MAENMAQKPATNKEEGVTREKVRARLLALSWPTNHPATGEPITVNRGDVVTIYRDQFNSMNDTFRPVWEEVTDEEK